MTGKHWKTTPTRRWGIVAGLALAAAPAGAATCLEQVHRLANDYGLAIDPPDVPADRTQLAPSRMGDLLEPPPTNDPAHIEPPAGVNYGMETIPEVDRTETPPSRQGGRRLTPEDRLVLESILIAARAESERGDERDCQRRLRKARQLVRRGDR